MKNVLLDSFETPPFAQIKLENYLPAIKQNIENAKLEIDAILNNPDEPNFKNTIEALEYSGEQLNRISAVFFNLNSANTSPEMQSLAQEISPLLTNFQNDIILNEALFQKIKTVYENRNKENLNEEQKYLLEKKHQSFVRNGANLSPSDKEKLRTIDIELAQLKLNFGENVLAETNAYQLHITQENDLKGLPDFVINQAQQTAKEKGEQGWVFTLQAPSYIPFMQYADNRNLREEFYRANGKKGFQSNEFNNEKIIKQIVELRHERAKLLGYPTHADFVLEERMAKSPNQVITFLNDLLQKAKPFAEKEIEELQTFAKSKDGIEKLMPWDHAYYAEKLKQEKFNISEEALKPYFKLENVLSGAFEVAEKLFGLQFVPNSDVEVYHNEVKVYDVLKNNEKISLLYADFFPRESKRAGAWMTSYRDGSYKNGKKVNPIISIVCNFTPSTETQPSLLTFNEVITLFHEFGHALHGILANTQYESLAGTNVSWDFVELPSQFYENFCYEAEALAMFAKHYQSGALIPQELVDKVKTSSNFLEGYQTLRQLGFGLLDMAYHAQQKESIESLYDFEQKALQETNLYDKIDGVAMSPSFSHIFQGGYSSGYYSYKWAEVLDADAFEYFKEHGIFNPKLAQKYYTLLSSGGTVEPMTLYSNFRGSKPTNEALLRRAGLS